MTGSARRQRPAGVAYRPVAVRLLPRRLYVEAIQGEGVLLRDDSGFRAVLSPLEVGRLRAMLRDEMLAAAWPESDPDAPAPHPRRTSMW